MQTVSEMQSTATSLFSAYASLAGTIMLFRSLVNDIIPPSLRSYIQSFLAYLFTFPSTQITIIIDEQNGMTRNQVYDSAEIYLSTKISPTTERFKVYKSPKQRTINVTIEKDQQITDTFGQIQLQWRFVLVEPRNDHGYSPEKRFFELSFNKKHKDAVMKDYLPFILEKAREIRDNDRVVKMYTRDCPYNDDDYNSYNGGGGAGIWGAINLDHPATFDKLAMEPEMKRAVIEDLDRFVRRRDYYRKVGKAWKRGYLLYGPPGTGKSSLIAAMANYLKFDIYDLELTSLCSNSELRRILISTSNRSIIVIEDIDCSVEMHDRQQEQNVGYEPSTKLTLSGLLNFIDGLWSSCGDERIIVFTTNYKEKLDPALLRPGRMDMHIPMSYCTPQGFRILASNYHGINAYHRLFGEIDRLIENSQVSPAELAEELMRSEDADLALEGVINLLKRKEMDQSVEVNGSSRPTTPEENNEIVEESSPLLEEFQEPKRKIRPEFVMRRGLRTTCRRRVNRGGNSRFTVGGFRGKWS
ncbi:AAA-ATPase At2g18193 [Coffea arabica]|uniref:AAA-ATPase At2g18193 n=1 Tax=Coffea arabica TaxID=13443 RepID=A0A6P6T893_COFAR